MSRFVPALLSLAALVLACAGQAGAASGKLSVEAESSWHADPVFAIEWDPVPPPEPAEAVFRIYDSEEQLARYFRLPLHLAANPVEAPPGPGTYRLEAWLESRTGVQGQHSSATLRFDNAAPAQPTVSQPADWLLSKAAATVSIDPPPSPLPLSGIQGYALSVDRGAGSSPCGHPVLCQPGEIDLAGAGGGNAPLGTLPEGVNYVRVVAVSGAGVASAVATAEVRVDGSPPVVSLQGAPAGWSRGPVALTAVADDELSGMAASGPLGPFTAISVDGSARRARSVRR